MSTMSGSGGHGMAANARIANVEAWTILDSRGRPTIRARVRCQGGIQATGDAPAGASRGSQEAAELRDGGSQWMGLGVQRAISAACGELAVAIEGRDARDQSDVDSALREADGSANLSRFGGNAIVAISAAVARCGSAARGMPLYRHLGLGQSTPPPVPLMNVLNGGAHASGGLRLQECMLVPHGPATVAERVRCGAEIYAVLRDLLRAHGASTEVGDEGGFVVKNGGIDSALSLLEQAIERAGYGPGTDVSLAIDAAANGFFDGEAYEPESGHFMHSGALVDWWAGLLDRHPIALLEDPLAENDDDGWELLTDKLGKRALIVGDDIFVTDAQTIRRAAARKIGNAALIKPNQAGTITGTLAAVRAAQAAAYNIVLSHRSGETCDTLVADLTWATGAGFLKAGAPARAERTEKYNRLVEIERELAS
jgi:enolase